MANPDRKFELRCPVHGFIELNEWEREIVAQPAFQRLRRIRQLAWTDQVYPGAMHTRFEHSLGVMHMASSLYDAVVARSKDTLAETLSYNDDGLKRDRTLVRLAALLHDVGHGPFSHATEDLFPIESETRRYRHEHYSAAIIKSELRDVIENHPLGKNYGFRADDVASLIDGSGVENERHAFWREAVSGQMDADRMDYLLRDSLHAGVAYGRFDWRRLLHTVTVVEGPDGEGLRLGVSEGGWHTAESLILARYFMFTQVYFHKTRVAFNRHLAEALRTMLPSGTFPPPSDMAGYLDWDDWKVLGLLHSGSGGDHGTRLATRNHYREIYHTPETPQPRDWDRLARIKEELGDLIVAEEEAGKSWYKAGKSDIPVASEVEIGTVLPLSEYSDVVKRLAGNQQVLLYVEPERAAEAIQKRDSLTGKERSE